MLHPTVLGLTPSFGFGDRLGLATPGHLDALREAGGPIKGIFAQQSIREMSRTQRTAPQVMQAAIDSLMSERYVAPWGADADHLKTPADVEVTAAAGFVFFTIDPSAHVDTQVDHDEVNTLERKFNSVREDIPWMNQYLHKRIDITGGPTIVFDDATVKRAAVKYGRAIAHALMMSRHIDQVMKGLGREYEIELSVDETPEPTTLAEHYIIAEQCRLANMKLVSLAPRLVGDFEKGVDFKGDLRKLEQSLHDHAALARQVGPYKLSLHSGSDKLSMYSMLARATRGCFHVKTAGTSYLEALRVVAMHDPALFRQIVEFSRARYDTDKATYHVSATLDDVPPATPQVSYRQLVEQYLGDWSKVPTGQGFTEPGRQILHCTFGSVLTHSTLGQAIHALLKAHPDTHRRVLCDHFIRHLQALSAGMNS